MNQRILVFTICVPAIFVAGCGRLCFYQAGKSIEQCERDLQVCFYSARVTYLCMQEKGYEYLDAGKLPQHSKLKKVRLVRVEEQATSDGSKVTSEEYWIADGRGEASGLTEYRVERGPAGKLIFTLVYKDEQKK